MKNIDISIVMGTYNRLFFLQKTIEKILYSIDKRNIEIIINDAGSTDGTIEWLKEIIKTNKNIKIIFSGKKTNIVEAYNECFKISEGKYVTWLSDDMYPVDNAIEEMCDLMDTLGEKDMGAFLIKQGEEYRVEVLYGHLCPLVACVYTETLRKYNYWNSDYPYYACDNEINSRFLRMGGRIVESSAKLIHDEVSDDLRKTNSKEFENHGSADRFFLVHGRYGEQTNELYPMINFIIKEKVSDKIIEKIYNCLKKQYTNSNFYIMFEKEESKYNILNNFIILDFNDNKKFDLVLELFENKSNIIFPKRYFGSEFLKKLLRR